MSEPNRLRRIPTSLHRRILASRVVSYCAEKKFAHVYFDACACVFWRIGHTRTNNWYFKLVEPCYRFTHVFFRTVGMYVACRYQHSLLAAFPAKSALNRAENACLLQYLKTFEDFLPYYCYTIKTNNRTICSQVSQPASVGEGGDVSEPHAHHCVTQ